MNQIYKPVFLRIKKSTDKKKFLKLIRQQNVFVFDTIYDQVKELVKTRNPTLKLEGRQLKEAIQRHFGKTSHDQYGVWVYYPWSKRLVHLLDRDEFVEVRTSRNIYKITPHERDQLSAKKIGIVGLSVGQSVSVTMAMERIGGELRLADFDVLELTNLNRIRTGVHNLNIHKVYSVAREIAEIDPFIKVKCFADGLTEKNMDKFFTQGGKLDLLVEESDGFDIKILSRYKARELQIPVIMEASDRCMVDVERFDLQPDRSILHGLVDHLKTDELKKLKTTEEKIPYMLDVLGIEKTSTRLKASMLEIEQSINTWPQLASSVTMGGGISADVGRRILLNQFNESGRYYVDVEEIIGNKNTRVSEFVRAKVTEAEPDYKHLVRKISNNYTANALDLATQEVKKLVKAACQAPSGGNSQPWRWVYHRKQLYLFNAFKPGASLLDYNSSASLIALGAALENLDTQASEMGLKCHILLFPEGDKSRLVAIISFSKVQSSKLVPVPRASVLEYRLTNRTIAPRTKIDARALEKMQKAAHEIEGADLNFIIDEAELRMAGDLLGELEKIRLLDSTGHRDFVNEMRWTEKESVDTCDGVDIRTVHLTNAEVAGFNIAREKQVINLIKAWNGGGAFKRLTKKAIDGAGAVGVLSLTGKSRTHYLNAGRALEKIWLEANLNGISFHPVSACLFMYARLLQGGGEGLDPETIKALSQLRPSFEKVFCRRKNSQEMFIFRLTNCGDPEFRSLRKPVEQSLYFL